MSLVDQTNPAFWSDGRERSQDNCFSRVYSGEPINWTKATERAAAGTKITAAHERQRAEGKKPGAFYGLSRKSDEALARTKYSPAIEGREAGRKATERRDAIRRGGI